MTLAVRDGPTPLLFSLDSAHKDQTSYYDWLLTRGLARPLLLPYCFDLGGSQSPGDQFLRRRGSIPGEISFFYDDDQFPGSSLFLRRRSIPGKKGGQFFFELMLSHVCL